MIRWTVLFLVAISVLKTTDGLNCHCDNCDANSVSCPGGACYTKVSLQGGVRMVQKHCYEQQYVDLYCNLTSDMIVIQCCSDRDNCNQNLEPTLSADGQADSSGVSSTPQPTGDPDPVLVTGSITSPSPHTDEKLVIHTSLHCYEWSSKKPQLPVSVCSTSYGSCYHHVRRLDGIFVFEKYGCMDHCVEEDRNRSTKKCCNTTLCNSVDTRQFLPSTTSLSSSSSTSTSTSTSSAANVLVSSTAVMPGMMVSSSGILLSSALREGSFIRYSTNTLSVIMPTNEGGLSGNIIRPNHSTHSSYSESLSSSSFVPSILPSTSNSVSDSTISSSSSSSFHPSSVTYITASVLLGLLYVGIMITLCLVIFVVYRRQKKLASSEKSMKKSTDTLVSVSVSV